ncbi:MAG: D-alanyl-D-alanine carboxypeptidase [Clostridia bacterium]|nr:D-alanyl-D-alanine carboxypeptidase [Clostridia bacterium]
MIVFIPFMGAKAYTPAGIELTAKSAMLVSLDTGEVLFSKNEDERVYPASITKIAVVTLILESPLYDPEAKIAMSKEALKLISGTGSVVSNLKEGEEIRQIDLIYYLLVSSCGDCAYLAALTYGETVENFVAMMNAKAAELGLTGTHYQNPVGLQNEDNYTTARDTYTLLNYALKNETFKLAFETARYTVPATNMHGDRLITTTNNLQNASTNYYYSYATGGKTGFTTEAGRCLVSTASYNGYNYMCLLFGCDNAKSTNIAFAETKEIFRWAFNNFSFKQISNTDSPVTEVGVELSSKTDCVLLYAEENCISVLPTDADDSTISIKVNIDENASFDAPIKKGQVLGTADIIYANQVIRTVNLVSHDDIEKDFLPTVWRGVKNFLTSKYMVMIYIVIGILILLFLLRIWQLNRKKKSKPRRKVKYMPYDDK